MSTTQDASTAADREGTNPRPTLGAIRGTARNSDAPVSAFESARQRRGTAIPRQFPADGYYSEPELELEPEWRLPVDVMFNAEPAEGIWHRDDGSPLIYANAVNTIVAEEGAGKTMCLILAARETIEVGGRVYWLNFDSSAPRPLGPVSRRSGCVISYTTTIYSPIWRTLRSQLH